MSVLPLASPSSRALKKGAALAVPLCVAACAGTLLAPGSELPARGVAGVDVGDGGVLLVDAGVSSPGDAGIARGIDGGSSARDAGTSAAAPSRSAGCGKSVTGTGSFDNRSVDIDGRARSYHVRVPSGYSPTRAYPVVFRFHGLGGDGLSGGLGIEQAAGSEAIVVAADGLDRTWSRGNQANDLALFDRMLSEVSGQYCVDRGRLFAYGFSAGAGFSNWLGCERVGTLRATAAIASFDRADPRCDDDPIAAWFQHDQNDPAVAIGVGRAARDRALARNGCSDQSVQVDNCRHYEDCIDGEPVVWCETSGRGHDIAGDSAPPVVWKFFSTLP